eukprot:794934-Amphidinium_carterae.1
MQVTPVQNRRRRPGHSGTLVGLLCQQKTDRFNTDSPGLAQDQWVRMPATALGTSNAVPTIHKLASTFRIEQDKPSAQPLLTAKCQSLLICARMQATTVWKRNQNPGCASYKQSCQVASVSYFCRDHTAK